MKEKNKVLIIGANGFIGSRLGRVIRAKYPDWQVYGVDKQPGKGGKFYRLDIKRENELKELLLKIKPRYIFHLAGSTTTQDFKELLLSHAYSSFCLFRAINKIEGYNPRIVIPSSAAEHSEASSYGLSKMIQTNLSLLFARQGLDIVVARIFNIIGEGTPRSLSIGRFAYELARMKKGIIARHLDTGGLDVKRDFLDIYDVCRYLTVLATNGRSGQIYNVCRGRSCSVRFLLDKMISISGMNNVVIKESAKYNSRRNRADSFGSAKKIRSIAGIRLTPLEKSLKATYRYYIRSL